MQQSLQNKIKLFTSLGNGINCFPAFNWIKNNEIVLCYFYVPSKNCTLVFTLIEKSVSLPSEARKATFCYQQFTHSLILKIRLSLEICFLPLAIHLLFSSLALKEMAFCEHLVGALLFQSPSGLVLLWSGSGNQYTLYYPLCAKRKLNSWGVLHQ